MDLQVQSALEKQNPWWFDNNFETGIDRLRHYPEIMKYLNTNEILFILGARRTGKSTILFQIIKSLSVPKEAIILMNLDEPLFQSKAEDPLFLKNLIEEYISMKKNIKKFYVFIDEIQNYSSWVQTIKNFYDVMQNVKFVITGSTSNLLQTTASTRLSGRYFSITIYPLSFKEFAFFKNISKSTILEKKELSLQYLQYGAFPRVVIEKDERLKQDLLKSYFQTIYLKDIIYYNKIRNNKDVFDLLYYSISNAGILFSYTNMGKLLNIDPETIKEYLNCAEQAYLLFSINKFDYSLKKQFANPKKIYCIDTGLINSLSFRFSENKGRLMENLVFINLKRKYNEIFYNKEKNECDFVIKEGLKVTKTVQVTISLKDEQVKNREIKGLIEAMNSYRLKEGTIITENEREIIKIEDKTILVKPLYEWLEEE